jgi:hypothetical protein
MANLTQEQISDALATVVESVSDSGVVLTDKKFVEARGELLRLLMSQSDDGTPKGWVISWDELPGQEADSDCEVIITYRYTLAFLYPYLNRESDGLTSEIKFKRVIVAVNEALNADRTLDLDNRVQHQFLRSVEPFTIADWDKSRITHFAEFSLDVEVINQY